VAVEQGVVYEFHFSGAVVRSNGRMLVRWLDSSDNGISDSPTNSISAPGGSIGNSTAPDVVCWGSATAPAGATHAYVFLLMSSVNPSDGYLFIHRVHFAPLVTGASATNPTPWRPAGSVEIHGGAITADTLNANKIVAGTITTDRLIGGAVNDVLTYELAQQIKGSGPAPVSIALTDLDQPVGTNNAVTVLHTITYTPPVDAKLSILLNAIFTGQLAANQSATSISLFIRIATTSTSSPGSTAVWPSSTWVDDCYLATRNIAFGQTVLPRATVLDLQDVVAGQTYYISVGAYRASNLNSARTYRFRLTAHSLKR
jgi:hypothetical protein